MQPPRRGATRSRGGCTVALREGPATAAESANGHGEDSRAAPNVRCSGRAPHGTAVPSFEPRAQPTGAGSFAAASNSRRHMSLTLSSRELSLPGPSTCREITAFEIPDFSPMQYREALRRRAFFDHVRLVRVEVWRDPKAASATDRDARFAQVKLRLSPAHDVGAPPDDAESTVNALTVTAAALAYMRERLAYGGPALHRVNCSVPTRPCGTPHPSSRSVPALQRIRTPVLDAPSDQHPARHRRLTGAGARHATHN